MEPSTIKVKGSINLKVVPFEMLFTKKKIGYTIIILIFVCLSFYFYDLYSDTVEKKYIYKNSIIINEFSYVAKSLRNLIIFTETLIETDAYFSENQLKAVKELGNPIKSVIPNVSTKVISDQDMSFFEEFYPLYEKIYNKSLIIAAEINKENLKILYSDLDQVYKEFMNSIEWRIVNDKEIIIDYKKEDLDKTIKKLEDILKRIT